MEAFLIALLIVMALALINVIASRIAEARNPPVGTKLEIEGQTLHFFEQGQGDPIVFLHGNVTMVQDFILSGIVEELSKTHRVVLFDRPGFGYSTRAGTTPLSAARQADIISAAMQKLSIPQAIICGHSWGTLVALSLVDRHPNQVRGLVLISGFYYPQWRLDTALVAPVALPVVGDVLRYTLSPLLGLMSWPIVLRVMFGPPATPQRFKEEFPISLALRPSQIKAIAQDGAIMNREAKSLLFSYANIPVPVALLAGAKDQVIDPEKQANKLHKVIRNSSLTIVPGIGHMLHHEVPDRVIKVCKGLCDAARNIDAQP